MKVLIVVEETRAGFSAYSPDVEGCIATGGTREEVERVMREAIEFHFEGLRAEGHVRSALRTPTRRSWRWGRSGPADKATGGRVLSLRGPPSAAEGPKQSHPLSRPRPLPVEVASRPARPVEIASGAGALSQ